MRLFRALFLLFAIRLAFPLNALDMCVFADCAKAEKIPGWQQIQHFLYPGDANTVREELKKKGIPLQISNLAFLISGDTFELRLKGIGKAQIDYLLNNKLLFPDRTVIAKKQKYEITAKDGVKYNLFCDAAGIRITNGDLSKSPVTGFVMRDNTVIQGLFLRQKNEPETHPALQDVHAVYFYVYDNPEQFTAELYIKGHNAESDRRICRDLNQYFSGLYAEASKKILLKPEHLNLFQVSDKIPGWTLLKIALPPEYAGEFFQIFGNTLQDLL